MLLCMAGRNKAKFPVPFRGQQNVYSELHSLVLELLAEVASINDFCIYRPRQNGYHFAYDIFKCIFLNENL